MTRFSQMPLEERAIFIEEASARLGVLPVIVEKDFWVTWTLARLFEKPEYSSSLVFKGGTSLSKVFGAIQRFSEDIDLSISPSLLGHEDTFLDDAPNSSQRRKRVQEIEELCATAVESNFQSTLEASFKEWLGLPDGREDWLDYQLDLATKSPTIFFSYPATVRAGAGYIVQNVKIEFGSLTDQQPRGSHVIRPMLADVLDQEFEDFRSEVVALELERTFWEKATILHSEYHRPKEQPFRDRFARHYSDFASLWRQETARIAADQLDVLARVVTHKSRYFASSWASYDTAKAGTLRLSPPSFRLSELSEDYRKMEPMFLTEPPSFEEICQDLRLAEESINS